ncbi:MAG: hypothetical protein Ta2D_02300 [Rickettsiales bacterium]|nr:MAG: hypothetical protein Ta2D_02300 [Rickettsiales bacterium]
MTDNNRVYNNELAKFYLERPTPKQLGVLLEKYNPNTTEVGKQLLYLVIIMQKDIEHTPKYGVDEPLKFQQLRDKYKDADQIITAELNKDKLLIRSGFYRYMNAVALKLSRSAYKPEYESNLIANFNNKGKYMGHEFLAFTPQSLITIRNQFPVRSQEWKACDFYAGFKCIYGNDEFAFAISPNYSRSDDDKIDPKAKEKVLNYMLHHSKYLELPPELRQGELKESASFNKDEFEEVVAMPESESVSQKFKQVEFQDVEAELLPLNLKQQPVKPKFVPLSKKELKPFGRDGRVDIYYKSSNPPHFKPAQKPVSKTANNETTRQTKTAPVVEVEPQKQDTAPIKPVETKLENNPPLLTPIVKKETPAEKQRRYAQKDIEEWKQKGKDLLKNNMYPHPTW